MSVPARLGALAAAILSGSFAAAAVPPVPHPDENPPSEAKRVLGKMLFWDEQLSSTNTVACGTCHRPASGGVDPRAGVHPGSDPGSIDDVRGSPGIVALGADGRPVAREPFGDRVQVTRRAALSNFGGLWAEAMFWDGRAGGRLVDPVSGRTVIDRGGALESQALAALMNEAEMSKRGRRWDELTAGLARAEPLALATHRPADVADALAGGASYPALFAAAFGDPAITPVRIAFALAAYQRTLVADRTPWDRYRAGDEDALGPAAKLGWQAMQDFNCVNCHTPPLFTSNGYANIGLRRVEFDRGRQRVTGEPDDAGDVKVPSLRNVALRPRYMHTGEITSLESAVGFYRTGTPFPERDRIPGAGTYAFNMGTLTQADVVAFLREGLTDPRVRDERYPFDRPTLRSERFADDHTPPSAPRLSAARRPDGSVRLEWSGASDDTGVVDYRLERDGRVIALLTGSELIDHLAPREGAPRYALTARDAAGNSSPAVVTVAR